MSIDLTLNARNASEQLVIEPQLVLEIDGVPTIYGARRIQKYIRIGDPGLEIGDSWRIGGFNDADDQDDLISLDGTTTQISQQLNPDKAAVQSVSSMQVKLLDDGSITELMSPGFVVTDLMYRRC